MPTAFTFAPQEPFLLPRALAKRETDLRRWTVLPHGGHVLPVEQPAAMVEVSPLRPPATLTTR